MTTGTWTDGPALPSPRFSSVVELVGTEVHLIGGWSFDRSNNVSLASHTVFDLVGGTYLTAPVAPLATARNHAYSGVIGGKIYVTGGRAPGHESNDGSNVASTEVYDPAHDSWAPLPDLPTPRSGGASAVLDDKLYVLGGQLAGQPVYKTVSRFDPRTGAWETLGDMPIELTGHRAVAVGTSIYVVGGFPTRNGVRQGFGGVPIRLAVHAAALRQRLPATTCWLERDVAARASQRAARAARGGPVVASAPGGPGRGGARRARGTRASGESVPPRGRGTSRPGRASRGPRRMPRRWPGRTSSAPG